MFATKRLRNKALPELALAGAGAIAVVHSLAAPSSGFRISAVASKRGSSARHLAGTLDARKVAIDALPAGAGFLVVATPPDTHERLILQGLSAGATVLVEKPLTTTLASADRIVSAAAAPDAPSLLVAENLLHSPLWRTAIEQRSKMGPLRHLSARVVQPTPTWGHFLDPLSAGGVFFDLGPHPIALVLELAGERPSAVSARLSSQRADGTDDAAAVQMRFASGLVALVETAWWSGDNVAGTHGRIEGNEAHWGIQAASDDAVVRVEFTPEPLVEFNGDPLEVSYCHDVVDPRLESLGYVDQLIDLRTGNPHRGQTAEQARDVLEIICAAYASAGNGGAEVDLPFTGDRTMSPMQFWNSSTR